jgi:hypothetical protein
VHERQLVERSPVKAHAHVLLGLASLILCACVSVERTLPDGHTERVPRSELRDYAQEVFKRRNAVSTRFLEQAALVETEDSAVATNLENTEQRMDEACAPVDALAIAYRDGERIGMLAKLRLVRALQGCAEATDAASRALDEGGSARDDGASQVH